MNISWETPLISPKNSLVQVQIATSSISDDLRHIAGCDARIYWNVDVPGRFSFLWVDEPNALVSTVKKSEDDNSLIVRLYDQEGRDKPVKINLFKSPSSVEHTNLIEEDGKVIPKDEKGMTVKLGHHAIETFKIRF
ncbi:MAG: glycosyl hydrolase-related protein [Bacteroidales bacterium]